MNFSGRAGDAVAAARFRAADARWTVGRDPKGAILAEAQFVVAREHGFSSWARLVRHVPELAAATDAPFLGPLIRPVELRGSRPYALADGSVVTTEDVYRMFVATRAGALAEVKALIVSAPALALVEYNYTPPIHFAVREGHLEIVELLIERGADVAAYRSYPFADSLLGMAEEREHGDVAALLRRHLRRRFALADGTQAIIDAARAGDLARVQAELGRDPALGRTANETGDTCPPLARDPASTRAPASRK